MSHRADGASIAPALIPIFERNIPIFPLLPLGLVCQLDDI